jgi:hypothetical protein
MKCAFNHHSDHKGRVNDMNWDLLGAYLEKISGKLTAFRAEIEYLCKQVAEIKSKQ